MFYNRRLVKNIDVYSSVSPCMLNTHIFSKQMFMKFITTFTRILLWNPRALLHTTTLVVVSRIRVNQFSSEEYIWSGTYWIIIFNRNLKVALGLILILNILSINISLSPRNRRKWQVLSQFKREYTNTCNWSQHQHNPLGFVAHLVFASVLELITMCWLAAASLMDEVGCEGCS